jgi:hypothetical protein
VGGELVMIPLGYDEEATYEEVRDEYLAAARSV